MRRTLQTTSTALDWLIRRGVPVELDASWQGRSYFQTPIFNGRWSLHCKLVPQRLYEISSMSPRYLLMLPENSNKPCDTGSSIDKISADFPQFDFSTVDPIYPDASKGTPYAFTRSANAARGQACLRKLHGRPEGVIAVVSHAGFLRTAVTHRRFANADYRIFTFRDTADGKLELKEDDETESKGGAMARSQKGIFHAEDWDFPKENIDV